MSVISPRFSARKSPTRIEGVFLIPMHSHVDDRGSFTEVFRAAWIPALTPIQWNLVQSKAGVFRGVHVHRNHSDYLMVTSGTLVLGLFDCRAFSPTFRSHDLITLQSEAMSAVVIPPGVAHGFYFPESSTHVYAVTHYWDVDDELGCRFDDPGLGIPWPTRNVVLSERDMALPSLEDVLPYFERPRVTP